MNEANMEFSSPDEGKPPSAPYAVKLPDGYDTWAAAWIRGGTMLWVQTKGSLHSYDFTNPKQVQETILDEPANLDIVPKPILDALRVAFKAPATPKSAPAATP